MGPTQKLLAAAAAETLERIRRDQQRVSLQLRPLLVYLEEHLFELGLDANQLKRACGVRDNSLSVHFRNALGLPPYGYIEDCRLQVACRLLRDTEVEIWRIAHMLGYSTLQVFSRAFHRWAGLRPSRYRERERELWASPAASRAEDGPRRDGMAGESASAASGWSADYPLIRLETLRRAVNGGLEGAEAETLFQRLAKLYPTRLVAASSESVEAPAPLTAEQQKAREAWEQIRELPWDEQRLAVRYRLRFTTPTFVELLWTKSREEGRDDRRRGVEIAELARESLAGIAPEALSEECRANLKAMSWAWISNARRLASDLTGADQALAAAEAEIPPGGVEPMAEAEILEIKAALRRYQRRLDEALAAIDRCVVLYRPCGEADRLSRALISRSATHRLAGNPTAGIPDLREALGLLHGGQDPYLKFSAHYALASCHATAGQIREANEFLSIARAFAQQIGSQGGCIRVRWLEGTIALEGGRLEAAEAAFREARAEFFALREEPYAAMASLDLAAVLARQGRSSEVLALTAEIIPICEAMDIRRESMAALQLLRRAFEAKNVSLSILQQARAAFHMPPPLQDER